MTAQKIKQVALHLFAEKGYEGTALSEIARNAGIKTPSIYAHFKSKEDLFLTVYHDVISVEKTKIDSVFKQRQAVSFIEQLKTIFLQLTNFKNNKVEKRFFQRAIYYPPSSLKKTMKQDFLSYETHSVHLLEQAWKEQFGKEVKLKTMTIWIKTFFCLLDGLLIQQQLYGEAEFEKRRMATWDALQMLIDN